MANFTNRVCLVTGAGSGIGEAVSRRFAGVGGRVIVTDVDEAGAARVTAAIEAEGGVALAITHDVAEEESWRRVVARTIAEFGRIDVLVNNAGYAIVTKITETALADWRRIFAVNCDGTFLGMKHVIPVMPSGGSIVNVSSIYGKVGGAQLSAYCATKGAVALMTKAAALECASAGTGIRVNSLHPGFVGTPAFDRLDAAQQAIYVALHPLGRPARPSEIADAALFLASEESAFMTGAELLIDGGYTAQ